MAIISGLAFPLEITSLGRFAIAEDDEKIKQNLRRIAATALRERWYEPNMGTVGYSLLFRNVDETKLLTIVKLVQDAIVEQEPRVQATVSYEEDTTGSLSTMYIRIQYFRRDIQKFNEVLVELQ